MIENYFDSLLPDMCPCDEKSRYIMIELHDIGRHFDLEKFIGNKLI